jgi:hypothetical protein
MRLAFAAALGVMAAAAASAQSPPPPSGGPGSQREDGGPWRGIAPPPPKAGIGLSTNARVPWPRLDAGAVVCRTREDLRLHAQIVQARADGTHYDGAVPQCRIVDLPIAIDILSRESPAATQVKLRDAAATTAWTDTWLPSTPPR